MGKHKKINFFRCLFLLLLLVFVVQIVKQEIKIYEIKNEISSTKGRIAELSEKQKQLQAEQKNASDPKYIEKIAREEYNMVKKGEIPVLVKE